MDSGMWALGLLIIPFIGFAIAIFLIIKFISFVTNKALRNKSDNMAIDYDVPKENKINSKEKTNLYKIFIILSILICIFLLPFVNSMTSKFPTAYPGNEASSGEITDYIANQIAIYVWPILIAYVTILIALIIKKTNYRVVYYPLSLFTLAVIFFNLGIIYLGYMIIWFIILLFFPAIVLLFLTGVIGYKLDNNTIRKKSVSIIILSLLLGCTLIPILSTIISVPNRIDVSEQDTQNNETEPERNNHNTKKQNEIKKEFSTLLNSNFISVNDLELSSDYTIVKSINLLISNEHMANNEMVFCNSLIQAYENIKELLNKYNYTSQTIHFEFTNNNPFAKETSTFYQDSGYIRDAGSLYFIYLNPTPIEISVKTNRGY